jgi:DNA repair protein RecO (recombination protein O)
LAWPSLPPSSLASSFSQNDSTTRMAAEKDDALVLRVVDFSESSCVVTLLTREHGKVRALAKGGRRIKGPFESALDLLARCRVVFLRKSSDNLDLLTEAKLLRRFRPDSGGLPALYAAYYVAELLNEFTDDYDSHPELFDLADTTLEAFATGGVRAANLVRFELAALRLLGHLPMLGTCAGCGKTVQAAGRVAFGLLAGGVLCDDCRVGQSKTISVSAGVIRTLEQLAQPVDPARSRLAIPPAILGELRAVLSQYICHLLGHRPRTLAYLDLISA